MPEPLHRPHSEGRRNSVTEVVESAPGPNSVHRRFSSHFADNPIQPMSGHYMQVPTPKEGSPPTSSELGGLHNYVRE